MFLKVFKKISTFADHHQALCAMIIGVSAISISWGVEKIFETYLILDNPLMGYGLAIFGGLFVLWLTKHYVLHEI